MGYALIFTTMLLGMTFGYTVIQNCDTSDTGDRTWLNVNAQKRIYIYFESVTIARVDLENSKGDIVFRINLDCTARTVKVTSRKYGASWKPLSSPVEMTCDQTEMQLVLHGYKKTLWVGKDSPIAISLPERLKGKGKLTITKNNKIASFASGLCIGYPPRITTCDDASTWYTANSARPSISQEGFLNYDFRPMCYDGGFEPVQRFPGALFACSSKDGTLVGEMFKRNHVPNGDVPSECDRRLYY